MWPENCDVDLAYHVRRMRIASPGGAGELDAAISEVACPALAGNALGTVVTSLPVHVADPLEWARLASLSSAVGKRNT